MALSFSVLTSGSEADYTATTASISPTYTPVLVAVGASAGPSEYPINMAVSGCGLTWTLVKSQNYGGRRTLYLYKGTGTPSSGTLSISYGNYYGFSGLIWAVMESPDIDSLGTATSDEGNGTSATVTLTGSPGAGDTAFAVGGLEGDENPTWESGWDELYDVSESGNVRRGTGAWDIDQDSTPSLTWSGTGGWGIIGLYIAVTDVGRTTYNTDPYGLGIASGVSRTFKVGGL